MNSIYPDLKEITVTLSSEGIAVLYLDRPAQRNAFTETMTDSLQACYGRLDADDRVKVVILTGMENKGNAFCAGADLSKGDFSTSSQHFNKKDGHNAAANMNMHRDGGGRASLALFKVRKPTIAAINGHAVGIGITMTLTADIRLAWKDAKIGFVFGKRGIVPEAASSYFLPKLIGHSRALELFMTARILPASSPTLSQLFSNTYETPRATLDAALALASEIALNNSMISMAVTKALVWRGKETPEEQHLLDSKAIHVTGNGRDSKEGVLAFKEKRDPKFEARVPRDLPSDYYPWWQEFETKLKL
ncbi:enoyl-CoA hydratase/isomerase family protein [Meredithblackwellia eburnea MCA 4105]